MQQKHSLKLTCSDCQTSLSFTLFSLGKNPSVHCPKCQKCYDFSDLTLQRQMKKFANLCLILCDSEEILSQAEIGVDVGPHQVQIPFRLLLTRLGACLRLKIEEEECLISFRFEPTKDLAVN